MKPLVDLVYPPRCPLCGVAIAEQAGLCGDCWGALDIPGCASDDPETLSGGKLIRVYAATYYNDASRRLVLDYKHGGRIAHALLLARLMAGRLPDQEPDSPAPLLVPVPLHRWRLWQRGFNQAALLAAELARLGKGGLLVDGLVRQRRTVSLGGLGREARERALAGAIGINPRRRNRIEGRDIIVVDDVFTSGATTRACVAALAKAGARSIAIACFARVEDGHGSPPNETPGAF